jgi:AcrR family transcriptional regulator
MPRRAGLTTEAVVETASRLADEDGLDHLTLARVAKELGVKPPSLYEHVGGLDGLRKALRLRGFRLMVDQSRRATVGRSGDEAVRATASELRRFVRAHPGLYQATVKSAEGDTPEIQEAARELLEVYLAVLRGYGLRAKEAIHALRYLRSVLHGFISLESQGGFGMPEDVDTSFRRLTSAVASDLSQWKRRTD